MLLLRIMTDNKKGSPQAALFVVAVVLRLAEQGPALGHNGLKGKAKQLEQLAGWC